MVNERLSERGTQPTTEENYENLTKDLINRGRTRQ